MRMSFTPRLHGARSRGVRRNSEAVMESLIFEETDSVEVIEAEPPPGSSRGWYASSLELRHGLVVTDVPLDTLPDDLISGFNKT